MIVNYSTEHGAINAARTEWEDGRVLAEPVAGTVIETDDGGVWQLREPSARAGNVDDPRWADLGDAWIGKGAATGVTWDGIVVRQTGRVIRHDSPLGKAVRVEITFVGDAGEHDTVVRGWMKVGR